MPDTLAQTVTAASRKSACRRGDGHAHPRRRGRRHRRLDRRRGARRLRRDHRRLHRLRVGSVVDSWIVASLAPDPAHRGPAARQPAHHLRDRGRGDPAVHGRMRIGGNADLGDGLPRDAGAVPPGRRRQGRGRRQGQDDRVLLPCELRRGALRRPDHRHRPHLGRRQADGSRGRHLALVSRRRGTGGRSASSRRRWGRRRRRPIAAPPMWSSRSCRSAASATACRSSPSRCSARSPIPTPPRGGRRR
jgi:hypothetical protein